MLLGFFYFYSGANAAAPSSRGGQRGHLVRLQLSQLLDLVRSLSVSVHTIPFLVAIFGAGSIPTKKIIATRIHNSNAHKLFSFVFFM